MSHTTPEHSGRGCNECGATEGHYLHCSHAGMLEEFVGRGMAAQKLADELTSRKDMGLKGNAVLESKMAFGPKVPIQTMTNDEAQIVAEAANEIREYFDDVEMGNRRMESLESLIEKACKKYVIAGLKRYEGKCLICGSDQLVSIRTKVGFVSISTEEYLRLKEIAIKEGVSMEDLINAQLP